MPLVLAEVGLLAFHHLVVNVLSGGGVDGIFAPGTQAWTPQGYSVRRSLSVEKLGFKERNQKAIAPYINYLSSPIGMCYTLVERC